MNSLEFSKKFNLSIEDNIQVILWDNDIGFSIFKDYENDYASLYKIGFGLKQEKDNLRKLWVTATYGKKSNGGISIGTAKQLSAPVDLDVYDEFFFDIEKEKFFHFKKEIKPENILIKLKKAHLKPTKSIIGFLLRMKLFLWRKLLPEIIKIVDNILSFLLELFTGEVVKDRDIVKRFVNQWHEESTQKPRSELDIDENIFSRHIKSPQIWSFLGFTSTRWSVVFYSLFHIFLYFFNSLFWKIEDPIVSKIFESNFLILCYVAVSFGIIEFLIPKVLKICIRKMPKIYHFIAYKRLRVLI